MLLQRMQQQPIGSVPTHLQACQALICTRQPVRVSVHATPQALGTDVALSHAAAWCCWLCSTRDFAGTA